MSKLGDQLGRASLPDSDAKERALDALSGRTTRRDHRMPVWARAAVLAGGVAVLVGLSLTPPGRAIAGDIGRLVGIGDEPTNPPTLGGRGVVIGSGEAARSFPFEIVAQTNENGRSNDETCVFVDFPTVEPEVGAGNCLTASDISLESYARNPVVLPAPDEFAPDGEVIVQGMIPVGAEVTLEYYAVDGTMEPASVYTSELTDELGAKIDVTGRASFFLAVLPAGVLRGTEEDPRHLTCDSVDESLSRVHYRVLDPSGETVVDSTLGAIDPATSMTTLGVLLLSHPPPGFTSDYNEHFPACVFEGEHSPERGAVAPD